MNPPIDWLLCGSPWVQYRTRRDLLHTPENDPKVISCRREMLETPQVQALVTELAEWPGVAVSSHKSAGQLMHKLSFLTDLGLHMDDPGMDVIVERILAHQSAQGPFQMRGNISPAYGGTGKDQFGWVLCDAPLVVTNLIKLGLKDDARVQAAVTHLIGLVRDNGWPCAGSPELGKWRGPGRKNDPCPYANLLMLKLLAELPELHKGDEVRIGIESALNLWNESKTSHPYMFYMGTDFRKLKAPMVWYDLLHVTDILTRYSFTRQDARLREMVDLMITKADTEGRFTPESIWNAWKDWDFGQKKVPSPWLTLLAWRVVKRMEAN